MLTRSATTFGELIDDLKKHAPQVKKQKVGNQIMTTVDGQVTSHSGSDDVSSFIFDHESIEKLKKSLGFTDTDSIDAHSVKTGSTMLIELTKANNRHLTHILLNNQANPAIADTPPSDAAVGGKSAIQYAVDMGRWEILEDMVGHHVAESIMAPKAQSTSNESAPTPRAETKPTNEQKVDPQDSKSNEQKVDPQKSKSAASSIKTKKSDRAKIPEAELQAAVKTLKQKLRSAKNPDAKSDAQEEKITATSIDDLFSHMKELIAEAKKVFKVEESKLPAETPKAATTPKALNVAVSKPKPEEIDTRTTLDKITASYPSYSIIYNKTYQALRPKFVSDERHKQDALFVETLNQIKQNPNDQIPDDYSAQYNQAAKLNRNNNYVIQTLYKDKLIVQSSAALLRDYFAPYSAPVSRYKLWSKLRRLLTFNAGRRYTSDAEKLYEDISTRSLDTVDSILAVYKLINQEIGRVRQFKHHKNVYNDSNNSAYVSRLCFMSHKIQATEAFRFNKEFSDEPEIYQAEYQKMQSDLLGSYGSTPVEITIKMHERFNAAVERFDGMHKINEYHLNKSLPEVKIIKKQIEEVRYAINHLFSKNIYVAMSQLESALDELGNKVDAQVQKIEQAKTHEENLKLSGAESRAQTAHLRSPLEKAIKVFSDYGNKSGCLWDSGCHAIVGELAEELRNIPKNKNSNEAALNLILDTKNYLITSGKLDPAKKSFFLGKPSELVEKLHFVINEFKAGMQAQPQSRLSL